MGGTSGTSLKRKSSSSLKKKRSHNSSQVRKRKRNQSRSRRNKSKKLRRRDDSISYSDDDYSRSSASISSSGSDDDYRRRQSRSRTRRDVKKSKKSTRGNSSSSERGRDARRTKKRKGSKRNADLVTRKKSRGKRPKRDVSVSSTSSGSRSCSTCRGDGSYSSGEEREYEKRRGRSDRKERGKRDMGKRGIKRSRHRSRSHSSCSRSSKANDYQSEEKLVGVANSTRLRSVITVVKQPEEKEERELDKDGHKEEIINDYDEYPSCRSNDSNDGGTIRELPHHSHVVTSQKNNDDKVKGEQGIVSSVRTTESAVTGIDAEDRYDGSYPNLDVVEANNQFSETNSGDSATIGSPHNVDLESILRQKALKNLRKFRGGLKVKTATDQKEKNDDDVKQSSIAKTDLPSHKEDGDRVPSATHVVDRINRPTTTKVAAGSSQNDRVPSTTHVVDRINRPTTTKVAAGSSQNDKNIQVGGYTKTRLEASELAQIKSYKEDSHRLGTTKKAVDQISMSRVRRNSNPSLQDVRKLQDEYYDGTDSGAGRQDVNHPPRLVMTGHSKASENTSADAVTNKSKSGTSALRREPFGTFTSLKQGPTSQTSPKDKQLMSKGDVNNSAAETAKILPNSSNNNGEQVTNASGSANPNPSSCLKSATGDQSSKELQVQGEAKEGSQYEQKTMTVMRGGEMVQVSYKVYIPKKTPALARRQLRR